MVGDMAGLTLPRPSTYGMYSEELNHLKEEQAIWLRRQSALMERKGQKATRPCPALHPMAERQPVGRRYVNKLPLTAAGSLATPRRPGTDMPAAIAAGLSAGRASAQGTTTHVFPSPLAGQRSPSKDVSPSPLMEAPLPISPDSGRRRPSKDSNLMSATPRAPSAAWASSRPRSPVATVRRPSKEPSTAPPTPHASSPARVSPVPRSPISGRRPGGALPPMANRAQTQQELSVASASSRQRRHSLGCSPRAAGALSPFEEPHPEDEEAAATPCTPSRPQSTGRGKLGGRARRFSDFDICVLAAKKLQLPVDVVRKHYQTFLELDGNGNGILTPGEFEAGVRQVCNIPEGAPTPKHLFEQQWRLLDREQQGYVSFEGFLLWSINTAFMEEITVPDEEDRRLRELARKHGWALVEVEKMKEMFEKFDEDHSGQVDAKEFKEVLCHVMKVKEKSDVPNSTLLRYFREVDVDGSGDIDFEEFVTWYLNVHCKSDGE